MRLLIAGGGTGGHVFPALAVAQAFRADHPEGALLIVGRAGGPEETLVPGAGFDLRTLAVRGLDRDAPWKNLALPVLLPAALARAVRIVDAWRPDAVLGVGGYVMAPVLAAARLRRVPYVLQVSEAGGLANRMFRSGAAAACVTFPRDVHGFATPRTELTGYPLRPGFRPASPSAPARRLLVVGGSQGARRVNAAVWSALDGLLDRFEEVVHLTGRQGEEESLRHRRDRYRPLAFSADMPGLMESADLVLCRCGVGTLAEVTAAGLPAILVPGTFGGGHQEQNAAALVEAGAGIRIGDADLDAETLLSAVDGLSADRLRAMAAASRGMGRPDAARLIVRIVVETAAA